MFIGLVMPSNHHILCHPLLLLPSIFPSIRVFSKESVLHIRWPMYWSFSFSISPSSEYSGLMSFRTDWFDLLAVQGTLKSLLQHHSSKASNTCMPAVDSFPYKAEPIQYCKVISLQLKYINLYFLKSISSLELSFLYGPTLTSVYGYWKNHSFD